MRRDELREAIQRRVGEAMLADTIDECRKAALKIGRLALTALTNTDRRVGITVTNRDEPERTDAPGEPTTTVVVENPGSTPTTDTMVGDESPPNGDGYVPGPGRKRSPSFCPSVKIAPKYKRPWDWSCLFVLKDDQKYTLEQIAKAVDYDTTTVQTKLFALGVGPVIAESGKLYDGSAIRDKAALRAIKRPGRPPDST